MSIPSEDKLETRPPGFDTNRPKPAGEKVLACLRCIAAREISSGVPATFPGIMIAKHTGCLPISAYQWLQRLAKGDWLVRAGDTYALTDKGRTEIAPQYRSGCPSGMPSEAIANTKPTDRLRAHVESVIASSQLSGKEPAFYATDSMRCAGCLADPTSLFFRRQVEQGLMAFAGRVRAQSDEHGHGRTNVYRLTALGRTAAAGRSPLRCRGQYHQTHLADLLGLAAEASWFDAAIQTRFLAGEQDEARSTVDALRKAGMLILGRILPDSLAIVSRQLQDAPVVDPVTAKALLPGLALAHLTPERRFNLLAAEGMAPLVYASAQFPVSAPEC